MTARKQGRRSAEAAEQTKCQILFAAAEMFCDLGYERVSLRNISERANVSHSLIRHHFGSKEQIWQAVSDAMDDYMQSYMSELIKQLPRDASSNYNIYLFHVKMLAFALINPQPVQMIADAIRQDDNALLEYFLKSKDKFEGIFAELYDIYNKDNPSEPLDIWVGKWQMLVYAHGAASLSPMLKETWPNDADNADKLLLNHWNLFNASMANQFKISKEEMLKPTSVRELVLDIPCDALEEKLTKILED